MIIQPPCLAAAVAGRFITTLNCLLPKKSKKIVQNKENQESHAAKNTTKRELSLQ